MAATTTIFNGTNIKIWVMVSGTYREVAYGTSGDVDLSRTMIDVSNKTDGAFAEFIAGRKSGKFSASAHLINDGSASTHVSFKDLLTLWDNGTEVYVQFGTGAGSNDYVGALCLIESLKSSAGDDSAATFDVSFQMTGTIAYGTS